VLLATAANPQVKPGEKITVVNEDSAAESSADHAGGSTRQRTAPYQGQK